MIVRGHVLVGGGSRGAWRRRERGGILTLLGELEVRDGTGVRRVGIDKDEEKSGRRFGGSRYGEREGDLRPVHGDKMS